MTRSFWVLLVVIFLVSLVAWGAARCLSINDQSVPTPTLTPAPVETLTSTPPAVTTAGPATTRTPRPSLVVLTAIPSETPQLPPTPIFAPASSVVVPVIVLPTEVPMPTPLPPEPTPTKAMVQRG